MTRLMKVLTGITAFLVLVLVVGGSTQASEEPQIVSVTLRDYQVSMSKFVVSPDRNVRFVVDNEGMLPHQLVVQPLAEQQGTLIEPSPVIGPGTIRTLSYSFKPGIYRIVCDEADHAEKGMVNVFAADATQSASLYIPTNVLIPVLALGLGTLLIIGHSLGFSLIRNSAS